MFVIVTYDVNAKRDGKVLKLCRKYLHHVQKSVFEGVITESKLKSLKSEIKKVINYEEDQISVYKFDTLKYSNKEVIGIYSEDKNII